MKNKPVAWINERHLTHDEFIEEGEMDATLYRENDTNIQRNYKLIPLYTHPANNCKHGVDDGACKECYQEAINPAKTQDESYEVVFDGEKYTTKLKEPAKTLTDEEITQCLNESMETKNVWGQPMTELNPIEFARAILRKAQEK